jgi:hypothetical protein
LDATIARRSNAPAAGLRGEAFRPIGRPLGAAEDLRDAQKKA